MRSSDGADGGGGPCIIEDAVLLTGDGHTASRRPVLQAWIPALIWLGIIAIESTGLLSSENTGRFLYPLLHFLFGVDPLRFALWHFLLRKSGHVVGYGILSVLLFRAWRDTIPVLNHPRWSMVWARVALFMTALVSSLDELHQSFLPSRTGTIRDVLLDSVAGLAAQVLLYLVLRGWRTSQDSETPADETDEAMKQPASDPTGL